MADGAETTSGTSIIWTSLTAVGDPNPGLRDQIDAKYPGVRSLADPHLILAEPSIDAVAIATPAPSEPSLPVGAIAAGKRPAALGSLLGESFQLPRVPVRRYWCTGRSD